jgi:hypothetical protein
MPPIEAVTSVTDGRGVGTADNELLSALTISTSSPFRAVLEANSLLNTPPIRVLEAVNPLGETSQQVLQDFSDGEPPVELLAILLNILAPAVMSLPSQPSTADSPRVVSPNGVSQSSENLITAALALATGGQEGETIAGGTPPQTLRGTGSIDTGRGGAQNNTSTVAATATTLSLFLGGNEGMRDGVSQVNSHITQRTFSLIPAQAPIVSNLLPSVGVPGELILEVPEPVGAVEVQVGLPSTQVGERPSVAGNRIALVAEMGAQLASTTPTDSSAFLQQFHHLSSHLLPEAVVNSGNASFPMGLPESLGSEVISAHGGTNNPGNGLTAASPLLTPAWTAGTPPTSTLFLPSKPIAGGEILEQGLAGIKAHLHPLSQEGEVEFRMHLHPAELGPLRVHLSMREGEIHGQLYVLDDTLRRLLQDQLPELRQRLEALGLNTGQWEISPDHRGPQPDTLGSSWQQPEAPPRETPTLWDDRPGHNLASNGWPPPSIARADGVESNHVDVIV